MLSERAVELGRLIGQSTEYKAVKKANDTLHEDKVAVGLLERMEGLRTEAQKMIERGENPTPEMEQQLDDLLGRIQVNPVYQRAIVAQENFDKLMAQVNGWILDGMKKGVASPIIILG